MGQYYKFVNVDKKEVNQYPSGYAKLTEHSYLGNDVCDEVLNLLNSSWKGNKIIHIGDYANIKEDYITKDVAIELDKKLNLDGHTLYSVSDSYKNVKSNSKQNIRYVYNHDKKEYIDLYKQPVQWIYIDQNKIGFTKFNSFALLTACGNGLGVGDYPENYVNSNAIGSWAGDSFTSSVEPIKEFADYRENNIVFNEMNKYLSRLAIKDEIDNTEVYSITNWDDWTEETIICCGADELDDTLIYFKDKVNISDLKLDSSGLLPSEVTLYSMTLDEYKNNELSNSNEAEMEVI